MLTEDRGIGITEALHGSAQDPILVLFALLTQLGDVWFLFLGGGVLYVAGDKFPRWGVDRRRALFVLGLLLTYVALIGVLKQFFLLPRPAGAGEPPVVEWIPSLFQPAFASTSTGDGPGFPSGHALGTTMVWGGFALVVVENKLSYLWLGVAGAVAGIISLSRLVLGVHYLVDVVVGAGLGLVILGVLYAITDRGTVPGRVLLVAVAIAALGLLQGVSFESVAVLGSTVGAWLVWRGIADSTPAHPSNRWVVGAGFAVLGLAGGFFTLLYALEPPLMVTFSGSAIAVGGAVVAPLAGEKLLDR
ncbi:phosphoesterase PA-phosphatase related protein (plasmid) [Haloterrigena turkmenica DSM 5511]|uniref:Phosphoesterase PA-phosphatase related protein n=1 Tax=Haloterrigena turkmenica (strain ATCC 51198 / DSM 5511 / JCM 9101 / NCIMB 13204 / VKM B-1734 / 4k) TaxID=543526 RepID=D2S2M0_HALTV|nr:phosphatase PAP2 family protein [Haloterrigena turkmenica]ADB63617.1 phosphoesterase PA-phosphatase related protein [Haloterrigena turkmenica DSM 5511]